MWWLTLIAAFAVIAGLAFQSGLHAGFVSDTFIFVERVRDPSASAVLGWFVPSPNAFYRPGYLVTLWLLHRLWGLEPTGYHVVTLAAHVLGATLLAAIALRVYGARSAAALTGLAFLLSIHAHEIVYDVAALHHALGGTALLACVLLYTQGHPALALLAAALAMAVNELGLLALPLVTLCEVLFGRRSEPRAGNATAARSLLPFVALTGAYFALRLWIARAGLPSEGDTCHSVRCLAVAGLEYVNRLVLRPEPVLAMAWGHRVALAVASTAAVTAVALLLRPWRGRDWRGLAFAGAWLTIGLAFVFLALWPYVADRFFYVPDMGLALLIGAATASAVNGWARTSRLGRIGATAGMVVLVAWIAVGGYMLVERGRLWTDAGREAARIVAGVQAAVPQPPPGASFCVSVPDSHAHQIPPGNTGPYVFRNGLGAALRIAYARRDVRATRTCTETSLSLVREADGTHTLRPPKP